MNVMKSHIMQNIIDTVLEALAPLHCETCGVHIIGTTHVHRICDSCLYMFELAPSDDIVLNQLYTKHIADSFLLSVHSVFAFHSDAPIQHAIHAIKYDTAQQMAFDFGKYMGSTIPALDIDALLPIPLHAARHRERGYNQSQSIADGISFQTKVPVIDALQRTSYTITQTKLTSKERKNNVHGMFRVLDKQIIRNKRLMLIDDVMTTGSTLEACAETLLEAGAQSVSACTLAAAMRGTYIQ